MKVDMVNIILVEHQHVSVAGVSMQLPCCC